MSHPTMMGISGVRLMTFSSRNILRRREFLRWAAVTGLRHVGLKDAGYDIIQNDPSITGIEHGKKNNRDLQLFEGSVYDDLQKKYGQFAVVISLEVIEHCYDPRTFIKRVYQLLEPGGLGIISTPYHGYLKNLAIAVLGQFDAHFTALWDGGHIKFFWINTMTSLVTEAGF